mgnify:CR=1 FL=1
MRDLLEELEAGGGALDPVERAKTLSRKQLPKRFYTVVSVDAGDDGFSVLLDGRPVRTAQRNRLEALPGRVTEIGVITAELGIELIDENGHSLPLPEGGYDHFR